MPLGCAPESLPPNVLLITVDTLRPDRLGVHGHSRETSPEIDTLAASGRVFTNAFSVSGWTLPSIASIMTGLYPKDHGATDFHLSVDPAVTTLATVLQRQGYDTRGYVSHVLLGPAYGVAEGFGRFDLSVLGLGHPHNVATATALTDLVTTELADLREPFFTWVHYFDPHYEYLKHAEWKQWGWGVSGRYDQEIAYTDREIGRLLVGLRERGLLENTIIIFTADHGEELGERGLKYHFTLFDEVLRVPLVIAGPGIEPGTDDRPVEQVDILPTVLGLLGLDAGPTALPGRDVLAPDPGYRPVFAERDRPPPYSQRSVRAGNYKLTVVESVDTSNLPQSSRASAAVVRLRAGTRFYDLAADPGEKHDLFSPDNDKAIELLGLLVEHFDSASSRSRPVQVDEELRGKLRSLGYVQ